jgi:ABC-type multidrug transport system ATPase subunit
MTLLELDRVSLRYKHGPHERVVLDDVSLQVGRGELVAVWGMRRSGRSTLLRLAAGIEPPDSGVVRFAGRDLAASAGEALGGGIGYCRLTERCSEAQTVLDELTVGQLARGVPQATARTLAGTALERVGASDCAARGVRELDGSEAVRVALARALALEPALLVIDEPTKGVDLLERDNILSLLRSLADERIAVLMSSGEATALAGADRALSLSAGRLRGSHSPELAEVLPLRRRAG